MCRSIDVVFWRFNIIYIDLLIESDCPTSVQKPIILWLTLILWVICDRELDGQNFSLQKIGFLSWDCRSWSDDVSLFLVLYRISIISFSLGTWRKARYDNFCFQLFIALPHSHVTSLLLFVFPLPLWWTENGLFSHGNVARWLIQRRLDWVCSEHVAWMKKFGLILP